MARIVSWIHPVPLSSTQTLPARLAFNHNRRPATESLQLLSQPVAGVAVRGATDPAAVHAAGTARGADMLHLVALLGLLGAAALLRCGPVQVAAIRGQVKVGPLTFHGSVVDTATRLAANHSPSSVPPATVASPVALTGSRLSSPASQMNKTCFQAVSFWPYQACSNTTASRCEGTPPPTPVQALICIRLACHLA